MGELHKGRPIDFGSRSRVVIETCDALLELGDAFERSVPACFQRACDVSLRRIDQVVAACRQRDLVSRVFECTAHRLPDIVGGSRGVIGGTYRGFHTSVRHCIEDGSGNRSIHSYPTDPEAEPCTDVTVIASTLISVSVTGHHSIEDPHHPAAAAAPNQTGQQRSPAASRLSRCAFLHVRVFAKHLLVLLELLPADVALMVLPQ